MFANDTARRQHVSRQHNDAVQVKRDRLQEKMVFECHHCSTRFTDKANKNRHMRKGICQNAPVVKQARRGLITNQRSASIRNAEEKKEEDEEQ